MSIDPGRNKTPGIFTEAWGRRENERVVHAELLARVDETETDWRERALCAQVADLEVFYPTEGGNATEAMRICGLCPDWVREKCLEAALSVPHREDHGVWGGTSRKQRLAIRKERGVA